MLPCPYDSGPTWVTRDLTSIRWQLRAVHEEPTIRAADFRGRGDVRIEDAEVPVRLAGRNHPSTVALLETPRN
jgi:hypothetical protein